PDGGVGTVKVPHLLSKRREFSQRFEEGVLLYLLQVGVAVFDRRAEQADRSCRKLTTLRLVLPGKSVRCVGIDACGTEAQVGVIWLLLKGRFERLDCPVSSVAEFRRDDDSEAELVTLAVVSAVSVLPLLQICPRLVLMTQSGVNDGTSPIIT